MTDLADMFGFGQGDKKWKMLYERISPLRAISPSVETTAYLLGVTRGGWLGGVGMTSPLPRKRIRSKCEKNVEILY
jgi:hypothetical protein